jgi:hypothetical protein
MSVKKRLEIYHTDGFKPIDQLSDIFTHAKNELGLTDLMAYTCCAYHLDMSEEQAVEFKSKVKNIESVFRAPVLQRACWSQFDLKNFLPGFQDGVNYVLEISHRPGVTDNTAASAQEALSLIGVDARVRFFELYFFKTQASKQRIERLALE